MARRLELTLAFFELGRAEGLTVVTCLACPDAVAVQGSAKRMAQRLGDALQTHLVDQGHTLEALQWLDAPPLERREVVVEFPEGRNPLLQPALRVRHVAFATPADAPRGMAFVPVLGVVAIAPPERLQEALAEAVRLESRRRGRRASVRLQVAAQWFDQVEPSPQPLALVFHSAEELRQLQAERTVPLLRSVANVLHSRGEAVGLAGPREALRHAAEGRFARSVLLVGEQGSGKTALVHHHVRERLLRQVPGDVWETSAARLIQGLTGEGGWQHALARLCTELQAQQVTLFVGHLVELFEVGQYEGNAVSLGDALREPVARGRVQLIAEATPAELAALELRSPGLSPLFETVRLPELEIAEQERVVVQAVAALAQSNKVGVAPSVVAEILALQRRFSPYSGFPGKGIRFFEELILHVRGSALVTSPELTRDAAWEAFCAETGMPRRLLDPALPLDLTEVRAFFESRLFGQPEAVDVVLSVLAATKTGLARTGKPIASLLLIGPTGVGKTETAKALAEFMFGDARRMIRLDMSEYADPAAVLRLLGDLGGEEGVLVGAVRRQPFSVLLLDELEKADPAFFDLLLQVLGEGRLTGGDGLTANFCGTIVLMTSNLGAQALQRHPMAMATPAAGAAARDARRHFEQAVQAALRPELFNRIDHVVPYAVLAGEQRVPIFGREIGLMCRREGLRERQLELALDPAAPAVLAAQPGDARYGARDVQRVLRRGLLLPLAHALAPHAGVQPLVVRVAAAAHAADGLVVRAEVQQRPLDGTPLRVAEAAAAARRRWQRMVDGPLYVHLLNQSFRFDNEHRRHDKQRRRNTQMAHWDETASAARQRVLKGLRRSVDALQGEIITLEDAALQALLGEGHQGPPDLAPWEARFLALQREVFHAMRPQSGVCTVGVYAPRMLQESLLAAWRALAALAGWTLCVRVVWLRDPAVPTPSAAAPAAKPSRAVVDDGDEDDPEEEPPLYDREVWPLPPGRSLPGRTVIVGHELELRGPAVFDQLRAEGGVWRLWQGDRKSDVWVAVHNQPGAELTTPRGVHRRLFFDARPVHRQIKQGCLSDVDNTWQVDWPDASQWKALLDRHFSRVIERMLQGEAE